MYTKVCSRRTRFHFHAKFITFHTRMLNRGIVVIESAEILLHWKKLDFKTKKRKKLTRNETHFRKFLRCINNTLQLIH